ncbi:hypothetical protein EQU24_08960 [Methylotuvimicrobium buryatense]|uniref:Uncharacterized protein n=1 Tax=Methylotuvimicrobium buryatense TaxID=95641 RepID=A0A4P9URQ0_METBY|nr:hypothetical protein EQU24_08960 [Methylotuvimicrobium buryatense]
MLARGGLFNPPQTFFVCFEHSRNFPDGVIPFALQISAVPEEASGCSVKALPAWSWHRAYMDVFTASFDGHPEAEFSSTMSIQTPCGKGKERLFSR